MRLLVSVRNADEVAAALAGGADIIDAKEPSVGALGAVALSTFGGMCAALDARAPISAALGDAIDAVDAEALARAYTVAGASFAKIGFAGTLGSFQVEQILRAAVRGIGEQRDGTASAGAIVAVAYADARRVNAIEPLALIECAISAGVRGVLLDTAMKDGPGLRGLVESTWLRTWVAAAHAAGLWVALAGKLTEDDVALAREADADIIGVRGAVCDGGRVGVMSADKVRRFRDRIGDARFERTEAAAYTVSRAS
jgi:(5-formylfuran-3-yl)methyl phosphate synthase